MKSAPLSFALALGASVAAAQPAVADNHLPKATLAMLKALDKQPAILDGLEKELAVPDAWVEAAKKEGTVRIYTTMRPKPWKKVHDILKERYPYIEFQHSEVRGATRRWVRPLAAFKEGRVITDVIMDLSGNVFQYRDANALIPLNDLPGYGNLPDFTQLPDHLTVAVRSRYWCIGYNTKNVKPDELPGTWEEVIATDRFANKRTALANRANLWLLNLWDRKGEAWGRDYTAELFNKLDPQRRKEGLTAILKLVGLGEADIVIPAAMNRVGPLAEKGVPVGHHCPEPVPYTVSDMGIVNKSPNTHAAKIFVNWFISKEGQMAQFWGNSSTPAHKDFYQSKDFIFYPAQVQGKKMAVLGPDAPELSKKLTTYWNELWRGQGAN